MLGIEDRAKAKQVFTLTISPRPVSVMRGVLERLHDQLDLIDCRLELAPDTFDSLGVEQISAKYAEVCMSVGYSATLAAARKHFPQQLAAHEGPDLRDRLTNAIADGIAANAALLVPSGQRKMPLAIIRFSKK